MRDRQQQILEYVIELYVKTAEPVSSFDLLEEYELGFSSATIRNELLSLEKEGFLMQPYTSAGRVPTDLGYRYYVNRMKQKEAILTEYAHYTTSLLESLKDMREINLKLKMLLLKISEYSGNVTLGKTSDEVIFEEGMNRFLTQPYFSSLDFVREALADLEEAKERIDDIADLTHTGSYQLYIGEENPISSLRNYSVIVGKCRIDNDEEGTIVMIGPKSMEYQKNIALIEYIIDQEEDD
jgi:transcriptional regulator of heat shock response